MKKLTRVIATLMLAFFLSNGTAQNYWIKQSVKVTGPMTVIVTVQTNLPDSAKLGASLELSGLRDNDLVIGTKLHRFYPKNGTATFELDLNNKYYAGMAEPPSDEYDVTVFYGHRWPDNKKEAATLGISSEIYSYNTVFLKASGTKRKTPKKAGAKTVKSNKEKAQTTSQKSPPKGWRYHWQMTDTISATVTLIGKDKDGYYGLHYDFSDGSSKTRKLHLKTKDGVKRLFDIDSSFGEYYVVQKTGDIKSYDRDGYVDTMKRIK